MNMVNPMNFGQENADVVKGIRDIDKKIKQENAKGSMSDSKLVTKLMYEQMLRGLFLTSYPNNFF